MEFHDAANLFPMMTGDDYRALRDDIAANGLLEPITLYTGEILDGRNRYTACLELGIDPTYDEYKGNDPIRYVISKNLQRRHLTSSQRAVIALEVEKILGERARERQGTRTDLFQIIEKSEPVHAADQAAQLLNTNRQYVSDAKKIAQEAPDLLPKIASGELTIPKAKFALAERNKIERPELPTDGKYRVIYADPPWSYGNTMPEYMGVQDHHYPLMTMQEICDLPVKDIAEDNAVLFLWVTSPILEDAFQVIKAWGFKYKASFVWDKVKHVMGHYNSVRHELLLVCVRGSCQPDVRQLFDSVYSEDRTEHSKKPDYFRNVIDTIYPTGNRIELFARQKTKGWDIYGNEYTGIP